MKSGQLQCLVQILCLAAMVLAPALCNAGEKTGYKRWSEYGNSIRKAPSLMLYYDFEEGAGNVLNNKAAGPSGQTGYKPARLNGTVLGPAWTAGRWPEKKALEFDGVDDYVDAGNDANQLLNITGPVTIELWIKPHVQDAHGFYHIVSKFSEGNLNGYLLQVQPENTVSFYLWDGGVFNNAVSDSPVSKDTWYHLAGCFDGSSMGLFINGVSQQAFPRPPGIGDNIANPLYIGKMPGGGNHYRGIIDEIAVYSRALTEQEIRSHYDMGRP